MPKALLLVAGLILMLGSVGCDYIYAPMNAKDMADHPLKPLPKDFRTQIWVKMSAPLSTTDAEYSRWDFYVPQGWKEGHLAHEHEVGSFDYEWRCDLNITFVKPKHQDEQKRYTFIYKDGEFVPEEMTGDMPKELLSPNSALPYTPCNLEPNWVAAMTAKLPDKDWTVDDRLNGVDSTRGVRALYFQRTGQTSYDSAVYIVEKPVVYSGWKYDNDAKIAMPIGESAKYYVYAYKGSAAWPTFEKDVMDTLFPIKADEPCARIGPR